MTAYHDLDDQTRKALEMPPGAVRDGLGKRATFMATKDEVIAAMAAQMRDDFRAGLKAGRSRVALIVPVGPVGQYPVFARLAQEADLPLNRLIVIAMDEYLTDAGRWISKDDPLSFRAHLSRHLVDPLPADNRPRLVVPDPTDPGGVVRAIKAGGGVWTTFAGVGITGHLAFNEPMPGVDNPDWFADLPTRVVPLLPETRLINSVTAARGNVARIPRMAVTVGMREILSARHLRLYMNRDWQCAAIRRLAFGPQTAAFPASLVQRHPDWTLTAVEGVLARPEPELA